MFMLQHQLGPTTGGGTALFTVPLVILPSHTAHPLLLRNGRANEPSIEPHIYSYRYSPTPCMYPASQIIPSIFLDKTVHSWFEWQSGRVCRRPVFSVVIKVLLISIVVVVIVILLHVIVVVSTGDHLFGCQVVKISTEQKKKYFENTTYWIEDFTVRSGKSLLLLATLATLGNHHALGINYRNFYLGISMIITTSVIITISVIMMQKTKRIIDKKRMVAGSWRRCGLINQFVQSCLSLSVSTSSSSS